MHTLTLLTLTLLPLTHAALKPTPTARSNPTPTPRPNNFPKGAVEEACQEGGYVWTTSGTGGWTCTGGLGPDGKCLYYTWTTQAPYWSCIGGAPEP
ncbi:hypothetical protein HYFRA_00003846 [Hymenoscyphus fraxineus]|uniref:Uncharacterized protein n=1 Tax=Hymenoscyphus fraxineus TaxID=746836 RepID=A0A9N9L0M1_9HELO|nr:hypothetical protein HYFRA_00003846 [Hymenoscyphus fraxineus]